MEHIKLGSPQPRDIEAPYAEFRYQFSRAKRYLPVPTVSLEKSFVEVLEGRRSRRSFGTVSGEQLSSLLWYTAHTRACHREGSGYLWQHRPVPSAGGRHPIDVLVTESDSEKWGLALYDPIGHALKPLHNGDSLARGLVSLADAVIPVQQGTLLWFVAQAGRTASKYEHSESLIWRDAGALLAVVGFVAEYLGLNCCAIGATGEPWLSQALGSGDIVYGVGGCLVGEPEVLT